MKKFVLIAAMILVPAIAQAGSSRSLTLASNEPAATPQIKAVEPAKSVEPAKTVEAPTAPCDVKATDAKATDVKATDIKTNETPQFVERPAAIDTATPADQPKPVAAQTPKAAKPKHKNGWTEARIIGELHRHGIYW